LYRHDEELYCRTAGNFKIDGVVCKDRGRITRDSHITGEGFSLKLEELQDKEDSVQWSVDSEQ